MRPQMTRRTVVASVAMAATTLAVWLALATLHGSGDPGSNDLTLQGVSPERLASIGITLRAPPPGFAPKISKQDIEASHVSGASSLGSDLPVREVVLAQV